MFVKTAPEGTLQTPYSHFNEQVNQLIDSIVPQFEKAMKAYVLFNVSFLLLGCTELFLLAIFFAFLAKSAVLAFSLAAVFLTFFSYFILRVYYQSKKPEQLKEFKETFLRTSKGFLNYQEGLAEHHVAISKACCRFAENLEGREYGFYSVPPWLERFPLKADIFSCWWHWHDIHRLREMMLKASVDENVQLVKSEPLNLEVHAALANAYVRLSTLYADPRQAVEDDEERFLPSDCYTPQMEEKFKQVAQKAIEEFKIIQHYAPQDPWVHAQLAYTYRDLKMPQEEIKAYENMLRINPDDKEILYRLGVLYFQQGLNAQGLRVYEDLKKNLPKKADVLMRFYGGS
jgi:tetratricopeptide (TPR) repeat protein